MYTATNKPYFPKIVIRRKKCKERENYPKTRFAVKSAAKKRAGFPSQCAGRAEMRVPETVVAMGAGLEKSSEGRKE